MIPRAADDHPTLAELIADEHYDPLAGMTRCRHGCWAWFHSQGTAAARRHYAKHEEQR